MASFKDFFDLLKTIWSKYIKGSYAYQLRKETTLLKQTIANGTMRKHRKTNHNSADLKIYRIFSKRVFCSSDNNLLLREKLSMISFSNPHLNRVLLGSTISSLDHLWG